MYKLFLVRGLPGAGKTTLAKELAPYVVEADHYFMEDGRYNFDPKKLKDAHKHCQDMVKNIMSSTRDDIAVSNTFTTEWEMEVYYDLAKMYDYIVFSLVVENIHSGKSVHAVPPAAIEKMRKRFNLSL